MSQTLITEIVIVFFCLAGGGLLKGATGAGAPILAVPALASFFDVRVAVITMLVPNLLTNTLQSWRYRHAMPSRAIILPFLGGGVLGVFAGSMLLVFLSPRWLSLGASVAVLAYVAARLAHPDWHLTMKQAEWFSLPAGLSAGVLLGASGVSAPVSITFLNAIRLEREAFITAIAAFFALLTAVQITTLGLSGALAPRAMLISAAALIPISLAMPVGAWLARHMSKTVFDRLILTVLAVLAIKLLFDALGVPFV